MFVCFIIQNSNNDKVLPFCLHKTVLKSKKGNKDQETTQSITTRDPGYHIGK